MSNSDILWFKDCDHTLKSLVGGKNASLGELHKLSELINIINIADGFAITTKMYDDYIVKNNLNVIIEKELGTLTTTTSLEVIRNKSEQLQFLIINGNFTDENTNKIIDNFNKLNNNYKQHITVAVRSSAIAEDMPEASFAGQQDTYLNIDNSCDLMIAIKKCYASLFNSRAISYRLLNNIPFDQVKISVGIQKMIRSDVASAGVAFSLEPNIGYDKSVIINGAWGLGELVVSGGIKPDEFIIDKRTKSIISKTLGNKSSKMVYIHKNEKNDITDNIDKTVEVNTTTNEFTTFCITNEIINKLTHCVLDLEKYYSELYNKKTYVDVEWAIDGIDNKLYILQTRPETIHSNNVNNNKIKTLKVYKLCKYNNNNKIKPEIICKGVAVGNKISSGIVRKIKSENIINEMNKFQKGEILVSDMTTPDCETIMKISNGIITNKGGKTCHSAIIARELDINACVGTEVAMQMLSDGDKITIDCSGGDTCNIYRGLLDYTIDELTIDTTKTIPLKIMLNVGNPEQAFNASLLAQDGVGLVRLEFIISNYIKIHPLALYNYPNVDSETYSQINTIIQQSGVNIDKTNEEINAKSFYINKLSEGISRIASAFYPNDVVIRLTDFKSNEYKKLIGGNTHEPCEENAMIGWRGASRYYSKEYLEAFKMECEAIKKSREEMNMTNIIIMIPFCRTTEECEKVLELLKQNGLERGVNGLQLYLMCEIPSNVIEAEEFSKYVDGVSIGGNDLLQLTLGIDRDSEKLSHIANHTNISYRRLIKQAIKTYKKNGVKVGFCGQQPSDSEEFCDFLIKNNIDSISIIPQSFPKIYNYISKLF